MATYYTISRGFEPKSVKKFTLGYCTKTQTGWCCGELYPERIEALRKKYAQHQDLMIKYQKECQERKDNEGAKFFKREARDALKIQRACMLLYPHYGEERPNMPWRSTWDFPEELFDELEYVCGFASLTEEEMNEDKKKHEQDPVMQHTNLAEIVDFEPFPRTALASKPKGPNKYSVTVVFWFDEDDQDMYGNPILRISEIFFDEVKAVKYVEEHKDHFNLTWKTYPVQE